MHLQSTAPSTTGTLTVSGNWSSSARASLPMTMGTRCAQAFNYPLFNRFFSSFSRFPLDFWP